MAKITKWYTYLILKDGNPIEEMSFPKKQTSRNLMEIAKSSGGNGYKEITK